MGWGEVLRGRGARDGWMHAGCIHMYMCGEELVVMHRGRGYGCMGVKEGDDDDSWDGLPGRGFGGR